MNLKKVTGPVFTFTCLKCGVTFNTLEDAGGVLPFADLDGEPFEAYYCPECFKKLT